MASMRSCKLLLLPDVYDIAKKVGEEFQRIMGEFGGNCVATLVPTVVDALEYLETYVEEYQTLQAQNYKLLLENDSLVTEREQRIRLASENEELLKHHHEGEREERRLSEQVDRLQLKNEELLRKIDRVKRRRDQCTSQDAGSVPNLDANYSEHGEETLTGNGLSDSVFSCGPNVDLTRRHQSDPDMMEGSRMHRRLSVVDLQLDKAKRKLNFLEQSCEKLNKENCKLKTQLEEYRAEAALKSLQDSTDGPEVRDERDTPKFYKRDLITVLRERNELKEELDSMRDELAMAKAELKQHEAYSKGHRRRSDSRVREILDTLTVSLQVDIPVSPLTPLLEQS